MALRAVCLLHMSSATVVYELVASGINRSACLSRCSSEGGRLPCIRNSVENEALSRVSTSNQTWIGYTDLAIEGKWEWDPSCSSSYTNWKAGEPNSRGDEDCGTIWTGGTWNDTPCWWEYHDCVCEKVTSTTLTLSSTTATVTGTTVTATGTSMAADACANTRGASASTQDVCTCGGSLCKTGELCLASENRCEACPASYELTSAGCQCPPDHASEEGSPCLEVLTKALERVADPTVSTSKAANGYTYLLELQLGPLPSRFFEALNVTYAIDIAPSLEALDFQSNCTGEWTVGPAEATIELSYGAFEGPCTLSARQDGGKFIRSGVVGIYIVSTDANSGMTHVEWRWTLGLSLGFDASVVGMLLTGRVAGDSHLGNRTFFDIGGFSSMLALYQSEEFRNELPEPYALTVGDSVHVQQRLDQPSPDLWLEVAVVYLSSSQDAGDSSAAVRNVTDQIRRYAAGESEARFAFTAFRCELCVIHVISRVNRRLGAEGSERLLSESSDPRYALQSVYIGSVEEKEGLADCTALAAQVSIVVLLVQVAAVLSCF